MTGIVTSYFDNRLLHREIMLSSFAGLCLTLADKMILNLLYSQPFSSRINECCLSDKLREHFFSLKTLFLAYLIQACYCIAKGSADTSNGTGNRFQNMLLCCAEVPNIS